MLSPGIKHLLPPSPKLGHLIHSGDDLCGLRRLEYSAGRVLKVESYMGNLEAHHFRDKWSVGGIIGLMADKNLVTPVTALEMSQTSGKDPKNIRLSSSSWPRPESSGCACSIPRGILNGMQCAPRTTTVRLRPGLIPWLTGLFSPFT
jgi:hypothetical protein